MDRASAITTIKALRAKTVANGCTQPEAESAAAMAQRMMETHGITDADLGGRTPRQPGRSRAYAANEYGNPFGRGANRTGSSNYYAEDVHVDWAKAGTGFEDVFRQWAKEQQNDAGRRKAEQVHKAHAAACDAFKVFAERFMAAWKAQREFDKAVNQMDALLAQVGQANKAVMKRSVDFSDDGRLRVTEVLADGTVRRYTDFSEVTIHL